MGRSQEQGQGQGPIHSIRLSTVGAARPTETGTTHEPTGLDLAMKLHYLKAAYIYSPETARDLTVRHMKESMFMLFDQIAWTTGRFSRRDSGRPYIKCNDSGTRFVEGQCNLTVEEWLSQPDRSVDEFLVYHQPIGPELTISPLIYVQLTRFKCGGLGLGLSWANIIGDSSSLFYAFNLWTKAITGEKIHAPTPSKGDRSFQSPNPTVKDPVSIKRVDPVGDLWVTPNNKKMATYCFNLSVADQISPHFPANGGNSVPVFEIISGIIWKCIAKVRAEPEPVTVTIIKNDPNDLKPNNAIRNSQVISSVQVDFPVAEATVEELVRAMGEAMDERFGIEEIGGSCDGNLDFVVYGAKLTFVDLSGEDLYGARVMGKSPDSVYCNVEGVGEEGLVVIYVAAKSEERVVTVTLPEEEMERVKLEFKKCGLIAP
ncbi:PREDICTED: protein ECERIFERUM 26 [Camelina sativa]|uniref:Protein ECERIFERUM 26 n=1 Tax=Camelina sativa TaxID=90675 RepID=A0ABM1RGH2_CAMSA|nr:PREDICTED: protein ECERIFERUM 26 [Camelina sativa]